MEQIITTQDTHSANGTLIVGASASGKIIGQDQGYVLVKFDSGQDVYVKPDHAERLVQEVPVIHTRSVELSK